LDQNKSKIRLLTDIPLIYLILFESWHVYVFFKGVPNKEKFVLKEKYKHFKIQIIKYKLYGAIKILLITFYFFIHQINLDFFIPRVRMLRSQFISISGVIFIQCDFYFIF